MGIQVEFNPDLALRNISEFKAGSRKEEECIPENLEVGKTYPFLKEGQRNYWLEGEVPLLETRGGQQLSRPMASIVILECTHILIGGNPYTKGNYKVVEAFEPSSGKIEFNGFFRTG